MPRTILVAQNAAEEGQRLCNLLQTGGYVLFEAADLSQASMHFRKFPALLLLDVEVAAREDVKAWTSFVQNCHAAGIPCLLFSSNGSAPDRVGPLSSWAAEIIRRPADGNEVLSKVAHQITVRRLSYQLRLVQERLLERSTELEEGLQSAAHIQKSLIPSRFPSVDTLRFAWRFMPCKKVGGDLFNVLQLDEETIMAYILDVSGHGISSAMVTVSVHQSLSPHTGQILKRPHDSPPYYEILPPTQVLTELEKEYPFERFDEFFTISYLLLNPENGQVRYSNAGHPPPILVRRDGSISFLSKGGTIIGMGGQVPFEEGEVRMEEGDRLFLYTDGITEHTNSSGEFFGRRRFFQKLTELSAEPLEAACEKAIKGLYVFGNGSALHDDVTLLGIEYQGDGSRTR